MNRDLLILSVAWIITLLLLAAFVPRDKFREAQVIFMFKQLITWLVGLLVVEFGLLEYPVEFFKHATKSSFSFEYFIYPSLCVLFNLYYPRDKSYVREFVHYFYFCSAMTALEVLCEKYTNLIKYIHWSWYTTWITLFLTFYLSRKYYLWFFKLKR